jgi:hypothetical protein
MDFWFEMTSGRWEGLDGQQVEPEKTCLHQLSDFLYLSGFSKSQFVQSDSYNLLS